MRALLQNLKWALALTAGLLVAGLASAQIIITNVQPANVTSSGFSLLAAVSRTVLSASSTSVAVFSDQAGVTNLTGQVGVEFYPLNSGDPTATNAYQGLLSRFALRQDSMNLGFICARVSSCLPGTTYYYQIAVTNQAGQSAVWPTNGPLPAVTTALENSFVLQSQQLLITVNNSYPPGSLITLSTSNNPSLLAAVVGDGAGNNQVFFSVNDLIAATGGTNLAPVGSQWFSASVFGRNSSSSLAGTYELTFLTNFSVGQSGLDNLGQLATSISIGTGALLTGSTGSVPISVNSQSAVVGLSFVLNFPTNLFSAISVQPSVAAVSGASVGLLTSNTVQLTFKTATGFSLQGNQQIALLNLTAVSNQPSAFVPLVPQTPAGTNADTSLAGDFALQSGRAVVVGSHSLLDMQRAAGNPNLVLYGIPGESYKIQSSTNLARGWSDLLLVPMTNIEQVFPNLDAATPSVFFRAYSFNADPPIIQASLAGMQRSLLAYGIPGTNYTLLTSTNLSSAAAWSPVLNYTLTNSFQFFTNLGNGSPVFYRLKR